jgi:iron complex outermembrane recepter protein
VKNRLNWVLPALPLQAAAVAAAGALLLNHAAFAADAQRAAPSGQTSNTSADAGGIPEIIVTAEKRSQSQQTVPAAVTAVSGDDLLNRQVVDLMSLSEIAPNVNFGENLGQARIAIRGLGINSVNPGSEGRVAFYEDGVYISRPGAILGTFFDIDRVEVLNGPQGTLYGRNAVAGAVNLITRDPTTDYHGYGEVTVGNYNRLTTEGGIGGPITDTLTFRVAAQTNDHSGWGKNIVDGQDVDNQHERAVRAKLKYEPSDLFNLTLAADYSSENDASGSYHYGGQVIPGTIPSGVTYGGMLPLNPARNLASPNPIGFVTEIYGTSLTANFNLPGDLKLTSITGYRFSFINLDTNLGQTTALIAPYYTQEDSRQVSEEIRLSQDYSRGNWIVGAYFFDEHISSLLDDPQDRQLIIPSLPYLLVDAYDAGGTLDTRAYAIFGQTDFKITDTLTLTVGGRYNSERKSVDEFLQFDEVRPYNPTDSIEPSATQIAHVSFDSFTPKAGLQYQVDPNLMLYASYSQGFKSGGYNLGAVTPAYKPEKLTSYEVGMKSDLLNRTVRLNASAFYYKFTDMQVNVTEEQNVIIENAASSRLYGLELQLTVAPITGLSFDLNAAFTKSQYLDYTTEDPLRPQLGKIDLSGNQLPEAPKFSGTFGAQYTYPVPFGALTLRGEAFATSKTYFSQFDLESTAQPGYALFNGFLNLEGRSGLYGSLFVKNIGNVVKIANEDPGSPIFNGPIQATYIAPRTYGVRMGYRF